MLDYSEDAVLTEQHKNSIRLLIEDIHLFKRVNQRYRGSTYSKKTEKVIKPNNRSENTIEEDQPFKEEKPTPSSFYLL